MAVIRVRSNGSVDELTPDGGMPLALMSGIDFMNLEVALEEGDIFVFYSDGISEARNTHREDFETKRLIQSIMQHRDLMAKDIQAGLLKDVQKFVGHAPQHDDMTFIIVKVQQLSK